MLSEHVNSVLTDMMFLCIDRVAQFDFKNKSINVIILTHFAIKI